jgi:hypothetical protein
VVETTPFRCLKVFVENKMLIALSEGLEQGVERVILSLLFRILLYQIAFNPVK